MSKQQENKNTLGAQMEFIARITMPDGTDHREEGIGRWRYTFR